MRKIISIGIAALLAILSFWFWWSFYYTYSEGNRSGLLQKMSYRGNLFKTYEGELVMNSIISNNAVTIGSEKFLFSVADHTLGEQMKKFEGQRVILHYKEKKNSLFWRGDTRYIVDSVSQVK